MKISITGGAGFIGSNFVKYLFSMYQQDITIRVIDSLRYSGNLDNLQSFLELKNFDFIHGDISKAEVAEAAVKDADYVINFAAESHVDRSISGPTLVLENNVLSTLSLIEAARKFKLKKYVQISTDEVYGSIDSGSWDETEPLAPNSPYAASKAAADLIVRSYVKTYEIDASITRCSNNYGPYQYPEKLIPLLITNIIRKRKLPIYGDGLNRRDWLHVNDHCKAIELVALGGEAGSIYNIGGGTEISNIEIARKLSSIMGADQDLIEFVPDRLGHDFRYSVDYKKIHNELGYAPTIPFEIGFVSTIEWYLNNRSWWQGLVND
jgi:dTDP-glucose 4,6-dehydratase